jgi:hypothetical protein
MTMKGGKNQNIESIQANEGYSHSREHTERSLNEKASESAGGTHFLKSAGVGIRSEHG